MARLNASSSLTGKTHLLKVVGQFFLLADGEAVREVFCAILRRCGFLLPDFFVAFLAGKLVSQKCAEQWQFSSRRIRISPPNVDPEVADVQAALSSPLLRTHPRNSAATNRV